MRRSSSSPLLGIFAVLSFSGTLYAQTAAPATDQHSAAPKADPAPAPAHDLTGEPPRQRADDEDPDEIHARVLLPRILPRIFGIDIG